MPRWVCSSVLLMLSCWASIAVLPPVQGQAKVGEVVPDLEFPDPVGHEGRTKLSEFFGQPVLVAGYRTNLVDGMHASTEAHELSRKYRKDGLVVIMVDRNRWRTGNGQADATAFWHQVIHEMPMVTSIAEQEGSARHDLNIQWPCPRDARSLVLIGVDGTLKAVGTAPDRDARIGKGDFRAELRQLVKDELKRRKRGWGEDRDVAKARSLAFGKDQIGRSRAALDPEVAAHQAVIDELDRHLSVRLRQVRFLLEAGRLARAKEVHQHLTKAVRGWPEWEARVRKEGAFLTEKAFQVGLKKEKSLDRLVAPLLSKAPKKPSDDLLARLRIFAEDHTADRVGQRAKRLDRVVHSLMCSALGLRWNDIESRTAKELGRLGRSVP